MSVTSDRLATSLADRYRIERELGQGGMATVYLAHDLKHDRQVAIKVLRPELAAVIGAERFLSEIKTTANLQHPHILPLFDSGVADSYLFYVMPFIDGESLRDRLNREKQLPIADAARIAAEVAGALDYAHRRGIVHRDIKPENILLHEGRALVADFGIALAASKAGGNRMTETGMSLGTPHYMSPEQAMGEREITARSDVYALGCVLYEMLVGEPPFTGPTAQAIVARVVTEKPRPLTGQRHTIPAHLEAAVFTALEKLPADRFASAAEFGRAIEGRGDTVRAAPAPTVAAPIRVRLRPVTGLAIGLALGLMLLAGWLLGRGRGAAPAELRHWNIVLPDSAPVDYFAPSFYGEGQPALTIARGGDRIAYVARRGGTTMLYHRRLDENVSHVLAGTEGAAQPFFSPDGSWIGYFAGGELRKVAVAGGSPVVLARAAAVRGGVWASNGRILFSDRDETSLQSVSASGGSQTNAMTGHRFRVFWPALLPGEEWVVGSSDSRRVVFCSLKDARVLVLGVNGLVPMEASDTASLLTGSHPRYVASGHLVYLVGNTLMALPFDPKRLKVLGAPVPVMQEVRREEWDGGGQYELAADGTLLFSAGSDVAKSLPVWVDHTGRVTDTLPVPAGDYFNIYTSPNGRRLALTSYQPSGEQTLSIVDLDRGLFQELRLDGLTSFGAWWPGGDRAIVHLIRGADRRSGVAWSVPVQGSGQRDSLQLPEGWLVTDVAPDSSYLAVRRYGDTTSLWLVSGDLKRREQLAGGGASWPAFSPDGRWVAYQAAGGMRVAAVPFTGELQTVAPESADEPEWSPRGDELYYRESRRWMAMSISTAGGRLTVGKPRLLFQGRYLNVRERSYDIGPDGRFLLLQGPPTETTNHLDVVTGFAGELRRLAPPGGK